MLELLKNFAVGATVGAVLVTSWYAGKGLWLFYKDFRTLKKSNKDEETRPQPNLAQLIGGHDVAHDTTPRIRIGVIQAMNGRILEVATATPIPGPHSHYDWKTEMYVVPEEQKLSEAIALVMLMKGLEK